MERLTKREKGSNRINCDNCGAKGNCMIPNTCLCEITDRLAAYEDAEEQGLLVRLPCKVDEIVWIVHPKYKHLHRGMFPCASLIMAEIENGCIICKTREEAEAALQRRVDT